MQPDTIEQLTKGVIEFIERILHAKWEVFCPAILRPEQIESKPRKLALQYKENGGVQSEFGQLERVLFRVGHQITGTGDPQKQVLQTG